MENCSYQSYTKSHQPGRAERFCLIPILPILSKVHEKLVLLQITDFIERQQVYNNYQSEFRRNYSTATSLSKLYGDIKLAMKLSGVTMAVFTDYSKAFDVIYRLLYFDTNLHSLNFYTDFLHWVFT